MVTRRLFPFVCQKDWQITKGFRNKLLQLNNTFYDLRQEGIILAVDCGLEGGGDSGGGGGGGGFYTARLRGGSRATVSIEPLASLIRLSIMSSLERSRRRCRLLVGRLVHQDWM